MVDAKKKAPPLFDSTDADKWYVCETKEKFDRWNPAGFPCNCDDCRLKKRPTGAAGLYVSRAGDFTNADVSRTRRAAMDAWTEETLKATGKRWTLHGTTAPDEHEQAKRWWLQQGGQRLGQPWSPLPPFTGIRPCSKPTATPDEMIEAMRASAKATQRDAA